VNWPARIEIETNSVNRWFADRHNTLTPTLAEEAHRSIGKIDGIKV
jgi:hypothetical protein